MEIRKLQSTDLFPMFKIIKKIGIDEFKNCFTKPEIMKLLSSDKGSGKNADVIGFNIAFEVAGLIIGNLPKAKDEIYDFLSNVTNEERKTIEEISPADFVLLINDLVKREDFKDFFKAVSKLFE